MALLGFLVFLDGHQVHRAHFVEPLLQRLDLLRHGVPIRRRAARRHFFRRQRLHLGRAFVGVGDGDALAADVVEVEVVFLLDSFAQVLDGHVFLRQFHFQRAALVLQFGQPAALRAQIFLARRNLRSPAHSFAPSSSAVCALTCSRSCCNRSIWRARILNLRFRLLLARDERRNTRRGAARRAGSIRGCAVPAPAAAGGTTRKLLLGRQRDLAFGQRRVGGIALLAQIFQFRRERGDLFLRRRVRALPSSPDLRRQRLAFLQAFLLLRGQALDFKNDRLDFLVQQPVGILQRVEFALARGDGDFLLAQFRLRLLQAGLQFRLLAQQRAAFAAASSATRSCNSASSACKFGDLVFAAENGSRAPCRLPLPFK